MRIDAFSFGQIVIGGVKYTEDVLIFPDRVESKWWRRQGHQLVLEDLETVLAAEPEVLVIGQGASGMMHVPGDVLDELRHRDIEAHVEKTQEAVQVFNRLATEKNVVAALHLTC